MKNSSYDLALHGLLKNDVPNYSRPSEWPSINSLIATNKIVGIYSINKSVTDADGVPVAFSVTCPSGTFTVNWGDGTSSTAVASGTKVTHTYTPSNTTGVTDTSYGYKCAVIQITATTNITACNFQETTTTATDYQGYSWLLIDINCSALTGPTNKISNMHSLIEYNLRSSSLTGTDSASFFNSCSSLNIVNNFTTTGTLTNTSNMFSQCFRLTYVPLFNTASVTTMATMFASCTELKTVPLFNTASVTTMFSMFNSCSRIKYVPLFNTASVTTMVTMFASCTELKTVPLFNTASVTNISAMFSGCSNLTVVPLFNTASVTNISAMFNQCRNLTVVPLFNTASVTSMSNMFNSCSMLKTVPSFVTTSVTDMGSMFNSCSSLESIPNFSGAALTAQISISYSLNCYSLKRIRLTRITEGSLSFTGNLLLGRAALVEIFTALVTAGTTRTINITGCRGAASLTAPERAIATGKNWTITG